MKLIIRIVLIGAIVYLLSPYTFWWLNMVAAFAICFAIPSSGLIAFIAGFLGSGLVWMGHAWQLDVANSSIFSSKIVQLFPVDDPFLLVVITGFVGGISAGFAALSGTYLRQIFIKTKQRGVYS